MERPNIRTMQYYGRSHPELFALAVAAITGWRDIKLYEAESTGRCCHAAVLRPDGKIIDIYGIRSRDEVTKACQVDKPHWVEMDRCSNAMEGYTRSKLMMMLPSVLTTTEIYAEFLGLAGQELVGMALPFRVSAQDIGAAVSYWADFPWPEKPDFEQIKTSLGSEAILVWPGGFYAERQLAA